MTTHVRIILSHRSPSSNTTHPPSPKENYIFQNAVLNHQNPSRDKLWDYRIKITTFRKQHYKHQTKASVTYFWCFHLHGFCRMITDWGPCGPVHNANSHCVYKITHERIPLIHGPPGAGCWCLMWALKLCSTKKQEKG